MSTTTNRGPFVQILLMIATIVATVFLFWLVAGFEDQSSKFWVSFSSIIFAELLTFGSSIWLSKSSGFDNKMFPYNLSLISMVFLYDLGVGLISLLALTPVPSNVVASLQVILLIGMCVLLTAFYYGGGLINQIEVTDSLQRKPATSHRNLIYGLLNRASKLTGDDGTAIQDAMTSLQEELEYATSESMPGSEHIDDQINTEIGQLTGLISAAENCGNNADASSATAKEIQSKTDDLKTSIAARDRLMIELRG